VLRRPRPHHRVRHALDGRHARVVSVATARPAPSPPQYLAVRPSRERREESSMGDVGIMGLHVPGMSWREIRDSAALAEDLGYASLSMGESWGEDALTSLAQLAAVTSRIRIGSSIVPVFARSPANLAMTALNLDRMSEGRFFLGLGTSGQLV